MNLPAASLIEALKASYPETPPAPMRPEATRKDTKRFDAVLKHHAGDKLRAHVYRDSQPD